MGEEVIGLNSMTYAMKAKRVLYRSGIRSEVIKINHLNINSGCTYGIKIKSVQLLSVVAVLRSENIPYTLLSE